MAGAAMRLLLVPERYPGRTVAAIGLAMAIAYASSLVLLVKPDGRIVIGDAVHYYVYLRSAVFDRDLAFRNEYVRLYGLRGGEPEADWVYQPTATGRTRNVMSVGPALVWAPLYLVTTAGVFLADAAGAAYPLDGFGRLFQASAGISGVAAGVVGVWFAYLFCRTVVGQRSAIWATVTMWLASPSVYYTLVSPTYSHAASMFASGGYFLYWARTRERRDLGRFAILGFLGGCAALVRWQDAVFLVAPVVETLVEPRRNHRTIAARLAVCGLAAAIAFAPQVLVWQTLYGSPLLVPQGEGFMRWERPAIASVLVGYNHGLFSWTPIVLVATIGVAMSWRRDRTLGAVLIACLLLTTYTNAAVADWWAGEAFGARRFLSCFPLFVVGLGVVFERVRDRIAAIAAVSLVFTVHTLLLLVQYQAFLKGLRRIVPYPDGFYGLWVARFVAPWDLFRWWLDSAR